MTDEIAEPVDAPEAPDPSPAPPEPNGESLDPVSTRSSLESAWDQLEAGDDEPDISDGPARDPATGKFVSKAGEEPAQEPADPVAEPEPVEEPVQTQDGFSEPPSRFSPDAKAAWANAPEPVKAEIHRALRETEAGIEKYRESAQAFEDIRQFDEMAKQSGTTIKDALGRYVALNQSVAKDPISGLDAICQEIGTSLQDVVDYVNEQNGYQPPEGEEGAASPQYDRHINQLHGTIQSLQAELGEIKQQVGGVTTSLTQHNTAVVSDEVQAFAAEHPRFNELSGDIKFFLETRLADKIGPAKQTGNFETVLQEAYELAERLNPTATPAPAATAAPQPGNGAAQTRKPIADLSVTGAPDPGSNPTSRKPPSSARDALERAASTLDAF